MSRDKAHLMSMLKDDKITQDDYNLLLAALNKKSFIERMSGAFLINPFQKIAGVKALFTGGIVMLMMSYLGVIANVYFIGALSLLNGVVVINQPIKINFFLLAYQNLVACLVLSGMFIIAAKILQPKKVRIIDFIGTVALARFPLLILTILMGVLRFFKVAFIDIDLNKGIPLHPSLTMSLFSAACLGLIAWQIAAYFYAFKESSGLSGKKLWFGFLVSLVLGELIASPLTTIFMN